MVGVRIDYVKIDVDLPLFFPRAGYITPYIIKKKMSDISSSEHHQFSTPLTVDINSGNNWGETH